MFVNITTPKFAAQAIKKNAEIGWKPVHFLNNVSSSLSTVLKPAGLVVHPGAGSASGTLVNALLHHCAGQLSGIGGVARPGIVHRLDKETSGLIVFAKTKTALEAWEAAHGKGEDDGTIPF